MLACTIPWRSSMERWIVLFIILCLTGWWLYKATRKYPIFTVYGVVVDTRTVQGSGNFLVLLAQRGTRAAILKFEVDHTAKRCHHKRGEECFHGRNDLRELIVVGKILTITTRDPEESRVRRVFRLIATK